MIKLLKKHSDAGSVKAVCHAFVKYFEIAFDCMVDDLVIVARDDGGRFTASADDDVGKMVQFFARWRDEEDYYALEDLHKFVHHCMEDVADYYEGRYDDES